MMAYTGEIEAIRKEERAAIRKRVMDWYDEWIQGTDPSGGLAATLRAAVEGEAVKAPTCPTCGYSMGGDCAVDQWPETCDGA